MNERVVARSIEAPGGARCVDIFRLAGGRWGFEEYRRDVEDGRGWFALGDNATRTFGSEPEALAAAQATVGWLPPD